MAHRLVRAKRRRQRRLAASALAWAFVALLAGLAVSSMFGGPVRLVVVRGSSMNPTFTSGDLIVVESLTAAHVGDIVSYPIEAGTGREAHIIHRAIGEGPGGFVTRGDNRRTDDPWTPTDDELDGRVVLHLAGVGRWFTGWALPILAAALAGMTLTFALWPEPDRVPAVEVT
jgi:signal peptidase